MRHGATRLAETTYFFPPKPLAELTSYTGVCLRSPGASVRAADKRDMGEYVRAPTSPNPRHGQGIAIGVKLLYRRRAVRCGTALCCGL